MMKSWDILRNLRSLLWILDWNLLFFLVGGVGGGGGGKEREGKRKREGKGEREMEREGGKGRDEE